MLPPPDCSASTLRHPTAARPHRSLTAMVGCVSFIWKHAFSGRPARSLCFSCKVAGSKGRYKVWMRRGGPHLAVGAGVKIVLQRMPCIAPGPEHQCHHAPGSGRWCPAARPKQRRTAASGAAPCRTCRWGRDQKRGRNQRECNHQGSGESGARWSHANVFVLLQQSDQLLQSECSLGGVVGVEHRGNVVRLALLLHRLQASCECGHGNRLMMHSRRCAGWQMAPQHSSTARGMQGHNPAALAALRRPTQLAAQADAPSRTGRR